MTNVPQGFAAAHKKLADSYIDIGTKLALVAKASGDQSFLNTINAYNDAADVHTKNFATLAILFNTYGVTFAPEEAGSVYSFTPTSL